MQRLVFIIATLSLATSASAEHIYGGLVRDNPDLQPHAPEQAMMAAQSKVSTETRVYHGLAKHHPDLVGKREASEPAGKRPDIYGGFASSPNLSY